VSSLPKADFDMLVNSYRDWLAFDRAKSAAAVRAEFKTISTSLTNAVECILAGATGPADNVNHSASLDAWHRLNSIARERDPARTIATVDIVVEALTAWIGAAKLAAENVPPKNTKTAALMMANTLWRYRMACGLRCSTTLNGATVAELIKIAETAGDRLTKDAAHNALKLVKGTIRLRNARK